MPEPQTIVGFLLALAFVLSLLVSSLKSRRHRARQRSSSRMLKAMFEQSGIAKTQTVPGDRIIRANSAFCELLGHTEDELRGKSWRDLCHPDDHAEAAGLVNSMIRDAVPDRVSFFCRYHRKDGVCVKAYVSVTYVRGEGCPGILLAEVQPTDEFAARHRETVARKGLSFFPAMA